MRGCTFARLTARQLLARYPRYLAYGFLHCLSSAVGQTYFVGLFVPAVSAAYGWADGTFAALYSGVTLAAAFLLPAGGAQVDRRPARTVTTALALALAAALCVLAATPHVVLFAAALLVARLGGQAVLPLISSTTVGRYFEAGRGRALALTNVGKSVAEVVVPPAAAALLTGAGFAAVWYAGAAWLALGFLPLTWWLLPRGDAFQRADSAAAAGPKTHVPSGHPSDAPAAASLTVREAFRDRSLRLTLPAYVFAPFVITGVIFNQALVGEARGVSAAAIAWGVSAYGLARTVCVLAGGPVVDRLGAERVLRAVHLPMLAGLALLAFAKSPWALTGFLVLAGMGMGVEGVLWPALWAERYGPRHLGGIKGAIRVFMVLGTAAAPVLFGYGIAALGVRPVLAAALAYGALAVALVWWRGARR